MIPPASAAWSLSFSLQTHSPTLSRYHLLQQRGVSTSLQEIFQTLLATRGTLGTSEKLKLHTAEAGGISATLVSRVCSEKLRLHAAKAGGIIIAVYRNLDFNR